MRERWDKDWKDKIMSKLRAVRESTYQESPSSDFGRKVQVIIERFRMGHTNLTNGHLMCNKESPVCEKCEELMSSSTYFN